MLNVIPLVPRDSPRRATLAERPDDELMLLVRAGRTEALAALVERYEARLTSFCGKLVGSAPLADEISQETWLRIWRHREAYRAEGKFVVLLYTTARNVYRNHARAARRREHWLPTAAESEPIEAVAEDREDHLDVLVERERQRGVHRALLGLPEPMREALLLRFQEELAYEDIAAIVGAPESTIRSRVHHGIKQLRQRLVKGDSR
jgi:RNA polymerase sigma-70 factor (ECF subfamily)